MGKLDFTVIHFFGAKFTNLGRTIFRRIHFPRADKFSIKNFFTGGDTFFGEGTFFAEDPFSWETLFSRDNFFSEGDTIFRGSTFS